MSLERTACRAAAAIERSLEGRGVTLPALPTEAWQRAELLAWRLDQTSRWPAARRAVEQQLRRELLEVRRHLDHWEVERTPPYRASWREIVDDLLALSRAEPSFAIDLQQRTLSLATEPILLDDVELGPFEIVLRWDRWSEGSTAYEVRALEPHPAGSDSSVTHPHVRDDVLCAGDGYQAIRRALGSGRIADFFALVARVLASYNPDSAFVRLDDWRGSACADCGATVDDGGGTCRCGAELCDGCALGCPTCGEIRCGDCGAPCAVCRDRYCTNCLERSERGDECCLSCLEEEEPPDPPVDALGLGQAPPTA